MISSKFKTAAFVLIGSAALLATPTSAVQDGLSPTVAPLVAGAPEEVYDPPAGTYPYFPHSIFMQHVPPNPQVDPNSAAWLALTGAALGRFQFARNNDGLREDYTFPIYMQRADDRNLVPVRVHCTQHWGHCRAEGLLVLVDPRALPEDGGRPDRDSHFAIIDEANRKEYDFWAALWPPQDGTLTIGWGGVCSLDGDGADGCSGTASSTPLSIGIVRVKDLFAAAQSPHGSLPFAINVAVPCTNGHTADVRSTDGHTPGCPPEGARVFLDMTDDEVNAAPLGPLARALLRTFDREHFGMIIADRNAGLHQFSFQVESDLTYTSKGQPAPLLTQLLPAALAEGWHESTSHDTYHLTIPFPGIDLGDKLKFLQTGPIIGAR